MDAVAFKEWAVIVEALGSGRQILILRKGGISEQRGEFTVDHTAFWLFPTYTHQQEEGIIPEARTDLKRVLSGRPPADRLEIRFHVTVETAVKLTDASRVAKLAPYHIWAPHVIEERFAWGEEPGITALVVRVRALPQPVTLPMTAHYAGCRSWVDLDRSLPTDSLRPVLPGAEFSVRSTEIERWFRD